jgi:hypothetical protein
MQEELISFETAKLAKEKGFDWECENYYDVPKYPLYSRDTKEICHRKYRNAKGYDSYYTQNEYKAPTQSLLQKWLREVHKIDVFVSKIGSTSYKKYYFQISKNDTWINSDNSNSTRYLKFEDALEKGLFESLKLIKQ